MKLEDVIADIHAHMNDMVIIAEAEPVDEPGPKVVWCNQAFLDFTGYTLEEMREGTPRLLQGERTDKATTAQIRKDLTDWKHIRTEVLNYTKDGREFWSELDIRPVADETGWFHYWVSVQRDVTERKAQQAELERLRGIQRQTDLAASEKYKALARKLELATSSAGIGIWDYNATHNTLEWDDNMFALYGVDRSDFAGAYDAWSTALYADDKPKAVKQLEEALANKSDFDAEFRVIRPDGTIRHIRGHAAYTEDADGAARLTGVNWDVTPQIEAAEREREASQLKSEFLANMSHEIRTPLNGVIGMAQVLERTALDNRQKRLLATIQASSDALLNIISDVLDLSKIEAGLMPVEPVDVKTTDLLEHCLNTVRGVAEQKHLALELIIAPDVPRYLTLDKKRVSQILINLLGNAVKFTDKGKVTLLASLSGKQIEFEVSDTGPGIPDNQKKLVFDRFRQVDGSATRTHEGTGLGLAISRELAQLLGGDIGLESEPGAGSTFRLVLPLAD